MEADNIFSSRTPNPQVSSWQPWFEASRRDVKFLAAKATGISLARHWIDTIMTVTGSTCHHITGCPEGRKSNCGLQEGKEKYQKWGNIDTQLQWWLNLLLCVVNIEESYKGQSPTAQYSLSLFLCRHTALKSREVKNFGIQSVTNFRHWDMLWLA